MANCKRWTAKEDRFLRANWDSMKYAQLSEALGRSISSVFYRANHVLHLTRKSENRIYTQQADDIYISDNWDFKTIKEIANDLGVSMDYVRGRARILKDVGIIEPKLTFYTESEEAILKLNWDTCSIEDLAYMLDKTPHSIRSKAFRMGLKRRKEKGVTA